MFGAVMVAKLNVHKIERLKAKGRYREGTIPGLILQITDDGVKSWILRFMRNGHERAMGLGPLHTVDLKMARELARSARLLIMSGQDPIEVRRAERAKSIEPMTFKAAAEAYYKAHEKEWVEKTRDQFTSSMRAYAYPTLGNVPINLLDKSRVLKVLEPIWVTKTETASRVRQRIEKVIGWAMSRGLHPGPNPASWKNNLEFDLAKPTKIARIKHFAAMPFSQISPFVADLRKTKGVAAQALEFLILTATRTNEVIGALWSEIDLTTKVWRIPGERMKMKEPHNVPLTERAIELLSDAYREEGNPYAFIGNAKARGLSNMALLKLLERMGADDYTVHGFRSTFRTWAGERTTFSHEVCEAALAHKTGSAVSRAYNRGELFERRRELMEAWAAFVERPAQPGEVVPLRRRA
jgi:integrase